MTNMGASFEGAVITTLRAPAFKCAAHLSRVVKTPVDQADVAPTLAAVLGLDPIPDADGKVLAEVKK